MLVANSSSHQSGTAVSRSTTSRVGCHSGADCHTCLCAEPSNSAPDSERSRLNSARSCANRILCAALTATAVLIMLLGPDRWIDVNTCSARPFSACIQAPRFRSMKLSHGAFQRRRPGHVSRSSGTDPPVARSPRCCGRSSGPILRSDPGMCASRMISRRSIPSDIRRDRRRSRRSSLRQMPVGVGLHIDGDVLVRRRAQFGGLVVVVRTALRTRELEGAGLGISEFDPWKAAPLRLCRCSHLAVLLSLKGINRRRDW